MENNQIRDLLNVCVWGYTAVSLVVFLLATFSVNAAGQWEEVVRLALLLSGMLAGIGALLALVGAITARRVAGVGTAAILCIGSVVSFCNAFDYPVVRLLPDIIEGLFR